MLCKGCYQDKDPKKFEDETGRRFVQCYQCRAVARALYSARVHNVERLRRERQPSGLTLSATVGGDNFRVSPFTDLARSIAFVIDQLPSPREDLR